MARAISFIHSKDLARARAFYQNVLGATVTRADDEVVFAEIGGHAIRIITVERHQPSPMSVFGIETGDIAAFLADLKAKGVITERFTREQDAQGVWTTADGEKVAWFKDPDGNMLTVVEARSSPRERSDVGRG